MLGRGRCLKGRGGGGALVGTTMRRSRSEHIWKSIFDFFIFCALGSVFPLLLALLRADATDWALAFFFLQLQVAWMYPRTGERGFLGGEKKKKKEKKKNPFDFFIRNSMFFCLFLTHSHTTHSYTHLSSFVMHCVKMDVTHDIRLGE
jgi:hypothetical protein